MKTAQHKVILLGTGGTIAGIAPDPTLGYSYADSQLNIEDVAARLPLPCGIDVEAVQLCNIGSEDFTEQTWRRLARHIGEQLRRDDVRGVVLTQGTDTIEETAFFLQLVLRCGKPVIVTGSMRPSGALSSDAALNLFQGIAVAAHESARGKGVLILMNERLFDPADAVKNHTFACDAFASPAWGPLAIMLGGVPRWARLPARPAYPATHANVTDAPLPRVDIVWGHAGIHPDTIHSAVAAEARGIVYAGTGNGSIAAQMKEALAHAARKGCAVVRSTRVAGGIVVRNAAENDDELGTIASSAHSALKSRILLQVGLARRLDRPSLQGLFDL